MSFSMVTFFKLIFSFFLVTQDDYVPSTRQCLQSIKSEYDIIVFLSTSKWIQLNYGDDGLKRTFKKIFSQLKPGGRLLFEPQTMNCYKSSKNITVRLFFLLFHTHASLLSYDQEASQY